MISNIEDYLSSQEENFAQFEEFMPRIDKIKEANFIGRKVLSFIDNAVDSINIDVLQKIDAKEISEKLNIEVNESLDQDVLFEIYKEIDETFLEGGRVNLEDYLNQGDIILNDMLHELRGTVDYSIEYSERQLKEEEKKAFDRFNLVMSMKTLVDLQECFTLSGEGKAFIDKGSTYLQILDGQPICASIEEKIGELNYSILAVSSMVKLNSSISDSISLQDYFSEKLNDVVNDLNKYHEDTNIRNMFNEFKKTIDINSKEIPVLQSLSEKVNEIDSKIFENTYEKDKITENDSGIGVGD